MHNHLSRRDFITSAALGAAAIAQPLQAKKKIPVALELYSIRQDCQADLPGSLAAVAKMGYDGVEFAGYYGRGAKELRKMMDDLKLKTFSTHIGIKTLMGDELQKTIEFNQILGNPRLTVASLPMPKTLQGWYDYAKQFNEIATQLKKHKMQLGFHNHAGELDPLEGKRPWDVFMDNTSKAVTGQLHTQHFPAKGLDLVGYITKYKGRSRLLHLNDHAPDKRRVLLGDGVIEWKKVFDAAEKYGGVECYIVEQESYPEPLTRMQCVEKCLENFRKLHGERWKPTDSKERFFMETSRRHFIHTAGTGAVLYKLAGPKPELRAAGPNDQIGLGFIGVGIRGSYHLDTFKKVPGVRPIVAADCYDGHLAWAKETTEGKIETTRDYKAVLNRKDVDAVVISTPDHWHARMVLDALAAGKHVYIEKPMTYTIPEGKVICDAAKKSGKLVMVGSQNKTSALTAKAREVVKSGVLGKVNMVRLATYRNSPEGAWVYPVPEDASPETIDWQRWLGPAPKHPFDPKRVFRWRCWWEYSGGVATDLWVHELTTMHEIMDVKGPLSAVAQGGIHRFDDGRTCPDLLTGLYEYPGFVLEITANLGNSNRNAGTVIMGSQGTMTFGRGGVTVTYEPAPGPIAWYGLNGWTKAAREKYLESMGFGGGKKPQMPPAKAPETLKVERGLEHWEYFVKSLREGTPSMESAEEGHHAAAAAHLGNLAFRKKRRLRWDLETNKVSEG